MTKIISSDADHAHNLSTYVRHASEYECERVCSENVKVDTWRGQRECVGGGVVASPLDSSWRVTSKSTVPNMHALLPLSHIRPPHITNVTLRYRRAFVSRRMTLSCSASTALIRPSTTVRDIAPKSRTHSAATSANVSTLPARNTAKNGHERQKQGTRQRRMGCDNKVSPGNGVCRLVRDNSVPQHSDAQQGAGCWLDPESGMVPYSNTRGLVCHKHTLDISM
jgi:hypothetical protein